MAQARCWASSSDCRAATLSRVGRTRGVDGRDARGIREGGRAGGGAGGGRDGRGQRCVRPSARRAPAAGAQLVPGGGALLRRAPGPRRRGDPGAEEHPGGGQPVHQVRGRRRPSPPHPSLPLAWPPAVPAAPPPRPSGPHGPLPEAPSPLRSPWPRCPGRSAKAPNAVCRRPWDPHPRAGRGCSGKSRSFAPTGPARPVESRRSLPRSHRTVGRAGFCAGKPNTHPRCRQKENP